MAYATITSSIRKPESLRGLMISTTIITTEVMDADALATAVFVMGPDKGIEWVDSMANVEAMLVLEDGSIHYSKLFRKQPKFSLK